MRPADRQIVLSTGRWNIFFVRRGHPKVSGLYGCCYWDRKQIYIRYDLSRKTVADTLMHEILHASNEMLYEAESFVTEIATIGTRTIVDILDEMNDNRPSKAGSRSNQNPRVAQGRRKGARHQ
jgi:hypothetical protein